MDTGLGEFAQVSPSMADLLKQKTLSDKVFEEGEELQIKGSKFRIIVLGKCDMTLRLIPDGSTQSIPKSG